jgi:hypothetical protein
MPVMLKMDQKVTGLESMDWIHLACDRDLCVGCDELAE